MKGGKDDDYNMQGTCYWSHVNDNTTQMLLPLLEPGRYPKELVTLHHNLFY